MGREEIPHGHAAENESSPQQSSWPTCDCPNHAIMSIKQNPELRSCGPLSLTTILIEINEMIDFRIDLQINVQI